MSRGWVKSYIDHRIREVISHYITGSPEIPIVRLDIDKERRKWWLVIFTRNIRPITLIPQIVIDWGNGKDVPTEDVLDYLIDLIEQLYQTIFKYMAIARYWRNVKIGEQEFEPGGPTFDGYDPGVNPISIFGE
jgi:hypothetical protein